MPNINTEKKTKKKKVPYYKKPDDMTIEEWQVELRKQFAIDQDFEVENCGSHPFFSDFNVYNPESESSYKIAIRSREFGQNFCSCPDFTINGLGTCKHIEYVLYQLKKDSNNSKYLDCELLLPYSSVSLCYEKDRKLFLRIGSENREELANLGKDYFDDDGYLYPGTFFTIGRFIEQAARINPDFRIYPDAVEFIKNTQSAYKRKEKIDSIFSRGVESAYFNNLIKTNLYQYQREGVIFGAAAGRVLIADDMGLGKTIQTIAIVETLAKEYGISKVLIVCPTSLKYQWKNEIEKFSERSAVIIEGMIHKRKKQYESNHFYKIISYGLVKNDLKFINEFTPDLVILDEAQRIKNWKTKTAQSVKKISSEYAIVLTGTPLENRIEELHSIIEFIDRYKLGALFRFLYNHQIFDDNGKVVGYKHLNGINRSLSDILLRRTKKEIEDQLPERVDKTYFVDMTEEQTIYHDNYYEDVSRIVRKWRKQGFLSKEDRKRLLINLNCMRMVCDSTYILDQSTRNDTKIDELIIIMKEIFENKDDKIVVFSQWERMTRLVAGELKKINIGYEYLHGGIPASKRNMLIENFHNNQETRVFLSTDAGGVGLNLQCANIVINIDLPWNPAVLEQRIGRVHRLGQNKCVRVINLVSRKSIEHRILYLIQYKKSVFAGVLDNGEDTVLMEESSMKSFMKSVEAMTEVSAKDGIYFTPHATGSDDSSMHGEEIKKNSGQNLNQNPNNQQYANANVNVKKKYEVKQNFMFRMHNSFGKMMNRLKSYLKT